MIVAKTIAEIRAQLKIKKASEDSIVLVPTMGALHEGHLALIKKAKQIAKIVVVSIFVNKAQFNDQQDYEKYPRCLEADLDLLKKSGATHVFLPNDAEIFSQNFSFKLIETKLTNCLCGSARAGHFDGVALIVAKLFNIIKPDLAIFGEKDFQQVLVIKKMVVDFNFDVEIIMHETLREKSGLALSSRNKRLSELGKIKAANIFQILSDIKIQIQKYPDQIEDILQRNRVWFLNNGFEKIDYLEIREEENLKLVRVFNPRKISRLFAALHIEGVRLIDNLLI